MVNVADNSKRNSAIVTADKLSKAADTLKLALSTDPKSAFSLLASQCAVESSVFEELFQTTNTHLDEWLANDLQQVGFLSESEELLSSPDLSTTASPTLATATTSPLLGFDALSGREDLMDMPLFDATSPEVSVLSLFPDLGAVSPATSLSTLSTSSITVPATPSLAKLTLPSSALTIPWTPELTSTPSVTIPQSPTKTPGKKRSRDESQLTQVELDEIAIKRAKNTDAARRSRLKKVMKMEGLEKRVSDLEAENGKLLMKVAVLESEKTNLLNKESENEERIKKLEKQLQEAHQALMAKA